MNNSEKKQKLIFSSFGFKYGVPTDANYVFDIRFIPNPYYVHELRPMSGCDLGIQDFLLSSEEGRKMLSHCIEFLDYVVPAALSAGRSLHVAVGCTGGRHRSVAFAEWFFHRYKGEGAGLFHRDINKEDHDCVICNDDVREDRS